MDGKVSQVSQLAADGRKWQYKTAGLTPDERAERLREQRRRTARKAAAARLLAEGKEPGLPPTPAELVPVVEPEVPSLSPGELAAIMVNASRLGLRRMLHWAQDETGPIDLQFKAAAEILRRGWIDAPKAAPMVAVNFSSGTDANRADLATLFQRLEGSLSPLLTGPSPVSTARGDVVADAVEVVRAVDETVNAAGSSIFD